MPRLSVLMPAYNAERTVTAAVTSTLRALPSDAELVVLDDGSTDRTAERIARVNDRRLRLISRGNGGVPSALNELLDRTDSEFIARMDADDLVLPRRFHRQLRAINSGADGVFTTVVGWDERRASVPRPTGIDAAVFGYHLLLTNPVAHSTFLARRSALAAVGGYRELPTEDYDLWLRLLAAGFRLARLALPGLAYRTHEEQITASDVWRRASWADPAIAESFATLSEQLLGRPARRITSLSVDTSLTNAERLEQFERFRDEFVRAISSVPEPQRRTLLRKLREREAWLRGRLATEDHRNGRSSRRTVAAIGTPDRRDVARADQRANAAYPKSRFILRWLRSAQRWRGRRGVTGRLGYLLIGGSYKMVTEWLLGCEIPASTAIGAGLRLRHAYGVVINPATVIGANVMIRQGVTLGNRRTRSDCPVIEDDVEIGVGAVIIGAVVVGRGAKIGPGAVVFRDVPAGSVVLSPESRIREP